MNALKEWIKSKPGPFAARTESAVWRRAWANFNEGDTGGLNVEFDFMIRLQTAGYGVRALAVGGYAMDRLT